MDLQKAIALKSTLSDSFLKLQRKNRKTISFSPGVPAPKITNIHKSMQAIVNGVGIGEMSNGENFIKVLTKAKSQLSSSVLSGYYGVRRQDIIIQESGPIKFKMPTSKHRPPFPGISVGHFRITAGTLGCFVKDNHDKIYVLSNNHVLANSNKGKSKDSILQPGNLDGGKKSDRIAELSYLVELQFSRPNQMDAAIAEIIQDLKPIFPINKMKKISGTAHPKNRMKVEKFGRTTGHTKGKITTRNLDINVEFDGVEIEFEDQFEIKGNNGRMFCDGGDSGSLIFESSSLKAVGLLFAGTDDGTTFANPIKDILNEFSVKIL